MKFIFIGIILSGMALLAQQPKVTTNVVTALPSYRIVNGQLYNTELSTNFVTLEGQCTVVLTNGVIIQQFEVKRTTAYPTNAAELAIALANRPVQVVKEEVIPGKKLFIRHYPNQPLAEVGSHVAARVMRAGVFTYESEIMELWDYGTPNTVVVVTTNSASTNALKSAGRKSRPH